MKKVALISVIIISSLALTGCTPNQPSQDIKLTKQNAKLNTNTEPATSSSTQKGQLMKTLSDFEPIEASQATITTNKGDMTFKLYREQAPLTTLNFLTLAKEGFYKDVVFHRVIEDFMAQVGDPLTKDESQKARWGSGGPGYKIADEFDPELTHSQAGVVSMANSGPNTGGSQFFITHKPTPWLDNKHAIFGQVTQGMKVLDEIEVGDKIISVSYQ